LGVWQPAEGTEAAAGEALETGSVWPKAVAEVGALLVGGGWRCAPGGRTRWQEKGSLGPRDCR